MLGIADVELIPARDVAPDSSSRQQLHPDTETLEQSRDGNYVFGNHAIAPLHLGPKLVEASDGLIVACEHPPAERIRLP